MVSSQTVHLKGRRILRNITSAVSLTAITLNLLFWILPLILVAIIALLIPIPAVKRVCSSSLETIYRATVWLDTLWLERVLGLRLIVHGQLPQDRNARYVVISNHRSWFDILLLQAVITTDGPIVKFLIKRELTYVPLIGWIALALNFPRLSRGKHVSSKQADSKAVANATLEFDDNPIALINFAEGTRFTPEKRQNQGSVYQHLLRPRSGGMKILLHNLPKITVIDVTLIYPHDEMNFWRCLSGQLRSIDIHLDYYSAEQITNVDTWLSSLWQEKDNRLKNAMQSGTGTRRLP